MIPTVPFPSPLLSCLSILFAQCISSMNLKRLLSHIQAHTSFILNLLMNIYTYAGQHVRDPNGIVAAVNVLGGVSIFYPLLQNRAEMTEEEKEAYFSRVFFLLNLVIACSVDSLKKEDIAILGWLLERVPTGVRNHELWNIIMGWVSIPACTMRGAILNDIIVNGIIWQDNEVSHEICNWLCDMLRSPEGGWVRECDFQHIMRELKNNRVMSEWCAGKDE